MIRSEFSLLVACSNTGLSDIGGTEQNDLGLELASSVSRRLSDIEITLCLPTLLGGGRFV